MLPSSSEVNRLRAAAAALLIGLLCGCATTGPTPAGGGASAGKTPTAEPEVARYPARVEVDGEAGFTVTEVAAISGTARAAYREALVLLAREDYAGGIELLREVTEQASELTAPFIDLGIAEARAGDLDAAEESLRAALARTPNHPVANNELGIVLRRLGRFQEARTHYERALTVQSEFHVARRNLGVLCDLYLADLSCAASNYEAYLQVVPDDRDVQIWLSDIQTRLVTNHQ